MLCAREVRGAPAISCPNVAADERFGHRMTSRSPSVKPQISLSKNSKADSRRSTFNCRCPNPRSIQLRRRRRSAPKGSAMIGLLVSAFAEENKLATIVGTKTPGRLLSGSAYKVGHGYILGLHFVRWKRS
jgi:hypothetical protein